MSEQNINLNIYELFAPLISASLINAIYQRASLIQDERLLNEKITSSVGEIVDLWLNLSDTIAQVTREHFLNQNKK